MKASLAIIINSSGSGNNSSCSRSGDGSSIGSDSTGSCGGSINILD